MDFSTGLGLYIIIAISLAATSYMMLFRPSIELLEEIIEDKSQYSGITGLIIWYIGATIAAPFVAYVLLKNDNDGFIEALAVALADKILDKEDKEE